MSENQSNATSAPWQPRERVLSCACPVLCGLRVIENLDLTDAERTKIEAIRAEYHPKIEKAMESLHGTLTAQQIGENGPGQRGGA